MHGIARVIGILCALAAPIAHAASMTMSQSVARTTVQTLNSISCSSAGVHADNGYFRSYALSSFGITSPIVIDSVTYGVELATAGPGFSSQPIEIRIYRDPNGGAPSPVSSSMKFPAASEKPKV